jgi:hypothetical protein
MAPKASGTLDRVQLQIRDGDESGFKQTRDWLLSEFGEWLRDASRLSEPDADEAVSDASLALDWKFGYGDGHLGRWTASDVTEFLLSWCPRKLTASQDDCVSIPENVASFTDYLAASRLLASGSATAAVLRAAATEATAEFMAEMSNPANFGMAKALFAGAAERGYGMTSEAEIAAWIDQFNALSDEEREAILPDDVLGTRPPAVPGRPLRPVVLPPGGVIEASKAAAPVLGMFAGLARFARAGRRLTSNGNLTLADARELIALLGTGDVMDPVIGGKVFRTRSSAELATLRFLFTWAKKAGIVRVLHGRMVATKRGSALASGDLVGVGLTALFDKALDVLLSAGPVGAQRPPGAWALWPDVDHVFDSLAIHLLVPVYEAAGPVPLGDITDIAKLAITQAFDFGALRDDYIESHISWNAASLADAMELAGVLHRTSAQAADEELGLVRPGGDVELTPAGLAALRDRLAAAGYDTPVAGRLAGASAADLVAGIDLADGRSAAAEVDAWLDLRSADQALAELADAVRQLDGLGLQGLALAMMTDIGTEAAAPHIRRLTDDRACRAAALCWLTEYDGLTERELYDHGDLEVFCDILASRLLAAEVAGLTECLALAGDASAQSRLVSELAGVSATSAEPVLEAIGRNHSDKTVAKAARKALFRRRSRLAASPR